MGGRPIRAVRAVAGWRAALAAALACVAAGGWLGYGRLGALRAGHAPGVIAGPSVVPGAVVAEGPALPPWSAVGNGWAGGAVSEAGVAARGLSAGGAPGGATMGGAPAPAAERGEVREAVAQRIDTLHRKLRITAQEQPLWDAFAGTMLRDTLDSEARFRAGQAAGALGAADGMEARARALEAHAAMLHHLADSFRPLYEAMSAEQRLAADQVFRQAQRQELRQGREAARALRD